MTEHSAPIDIDAGWLSAVTFSANGEFLVSGGGDGVQVWRTQDAERVEARMETIGVLCVAVSPDGRWIAGGTNWGEVSVWEAATYREILQHRGDFHCINAVDFSHRSTQLVSASDNCTATIWDVETRKQARTLEHEDAVNAAKYSPLGDLVATATRSHVRVWASNDSGGLLVDITLNVTPYLNTSLCWSNRRLFVVSDKEIKQVDVSTGSTVSAWQVPYTNNQSCIALPTHGTFVVYSTSCTVTLWDASTHSELSRIRYSEDIRSIAISPDDRSIAIGGMDGKIRIESLPYVVGSTRDQDERPVGINDNNQPDSTLRALYMADLISPATFHEPNVEIEDTVLEVWKQGRLENAETLLTEAITASLNPSHRILVSRALVRARLQKWPMAIADAQKALEIQPSAIACIAKGLAYVSNGERHKGYRACDIGFHHLHSSHATFLLVMKAIVVFMAGEDADAISRMDDLIATVHSNSECCVVQAYMHFLVGKTRMENSDYESAIESFENARAKLRPLAGGRFVWSRWQISGWKFDDFDIVTEQYMCEALFSAGRTVDAVKGFRLLTSNLAEETNPQREYREWALDFRQRWSCRLRHLGDAAAEAKKYEEAISIYSAALSLDSSSPGDILIKRSKMYLVVGSCRQALDDANQVIALDSSSPRGYEMKHAVLHKAGKHENAVIAFEEMLSKIEQSPDMEVQRLGDRFIRPSSTRATIRKLVQKTTRHLPRELINTSNGRLYNRKELESVFESSAIFRELVSSMTARIDHVRIKRSVQQFFRYVMLSHKWEDSEPLFHHVKHISVYDLDPFATHDKLRTFCKVVRDAGFDWAWSDTCCINQSDHFVLQEALVAMFKWYEGSALTVVYLGGVLSSAQPGALVRSVWNTRLWTLQEYIAAKVVLFYTEDWKLYLDIQLENHKESPEVISEMEEATGIHAEELMALRPGLTNIREKLRLASSRNTALVEDEAYSLLGIFSASGIPAIYGEGEGALGRLLANVLTRSGDVSLLAWTGGCGPFNSCLPAHVSAFNGPVTSHFPACFTKAEMETIITPSPFELAAALRLYDHLRDLPTPRFAESRMTLPCFIFCLPRLLCYGISSSQIRVYYLDTKAFGRVEIRTQYDLSRVGTLYLVHPWLGSLMEPENMHSVSGDPPPPPSPNLDDVDMNDSEINDAEFEHQLPSLSPSPPVQMAATDREARARRLYARLRQPFGALLFRLTSADPRMAAYKRVAPDSLITVRFCEDFSLASILEMVRTVDVL